MKKTRLGLETGAANFVAIPACSLATAMSADSAAELSMDARNGHPSSMSLEGGCSAFAATPAGNFMNLEMGLEGTQRICIASDYDRGGW